MKNTCDKRSAGSCTNDEVDHQHLQQTIVQAHFTNSVGHPMFITMFLSDTISRTKTIHLHNTGRPRGTHCISWPKIMQTFTGDTILNVIAFLPRKDVINFASTCGCHRSICFSSFVFDSMTIGGAQDDPFRVQKLLSLFPKLQHISVEGSGYIDYTAEVYLPETLALNSLEVDCTLGSNFLNLLSHCGLFSFCCFVLTIPRQTETTEPSRCKLGAVKGPSCSKSYFPLVFFAISNLIDSF